ncbi:RICIN domain-containing protein [Yinghuangia seranimata]|uniref:RICIN domain-containing protein n=1 Tax=Yinghuangia seranimata TaxID=408067 RepID=UPI00248B9D6A|nr:RICIN domain-containing protein [Yinghuangia seranimata]MDI2125232.1 RICIN domain-containing protein [Yinghuangia seranimata]
MKAVRLTTLATTLSGLMLFSGTASAQAGSVTWQPIYNGNSSKCLEIENSSGSNGARAQQWACKGQTGALWRKIYTSDDGEFELRNYDGKCLEVENFLTANGARVQQWTCKGQPGSKWFLYNGDIRGPVYVNANSGKCLEVENSATWDGARVQQWDCVRQPGAYWWT